MGNKSDEQEERRDEMNDRCLFQDPESSFTIQSSVKRKRTKCLLEDFVLHIPKICLH